MNVPLAAETIAQIGSLHVTNSLVNAWIVTFFLLIVAALIRFRMKLIPHGLQNVAEVIVEYFLNLGDSITHDRSHTKKFLPLVVTLFIYILLNNWMSQLPGTGSIGFWHGADFTPLLRPATSDLNLTLALGMFSILCTHFVGIGMIGAWRHVNKFIQVGPLIKSFGKGPVGIMRGFVEFAVGIIEAVGELARIISLSLRLFGNIFAGEVLITVMLSLSAYLVPLPFQALELLVGVIQAGVFSILVLVFMTLSAEPPHGEHEAVAAHQ